MTSLHRFALLYCVNTLWQVPLLYAVSYLSDKLASHSGARLRHRLWLGTFVLCLILPVVSATGYPRAYLEHALVQTRQVSRSASAAIVERADVVRSSAKTKSLYFPGITEANVVLGLWVLYVLYRNARTVWAYRRIRGIISTAHQGHTEHCEAAELLKTQRGRSGHLAILISEEITMPATAGVRQPVVLLPKDFMRAASKTDLAAVLAHEEAHVARHDSFGM